MQDGRRIMHRLQRANIKDVTTANVRMRNFCLFCGLMSLPSKKFAPLLDLSLRLRFFAATPSKCILVRLTGFFLPRQFYRTLSISLSTCTTVFCSFYALTVLLICSDFSMISVKQVGYSVWIIVARNSLLTRFGTKYSGSGKQSNAAGHFLAASISLFKVN